MAASDHLSPDQFYHGTPHKLHPGDLVTPGRGANFAGPDDTGYPGEHYSYATTNSARAWQWADDANNARHELGMPPIGKGRSRVYQVEPTADMTEDDENPGMEDYRTSGPMRVVKRVVYHSPQTLQSQPVSDEAESRPVRYYHPESGWHVDTSVKRHPDGSIQHR